MGRVLNNILDTREIMTGKDGRLFVQAGDVNMFLAEINIYKVTMNVNVAEKQPVGSIVVHRIPTGVTFDLSFTEMVVRDDLIMKPLLDAIQKGNLPDFNFQGVAVKPDGTEERLSFENAVPNGSFGLQSLTPGEVIEREQTFALNKIPKFISHLKSSYLASLNEDALSTLDGV